MRAGLLGRKLGHSFSPQIHARLGSYSYGLFEVEPDALDAFLTGGSFDALNVTIPYKKSVIPYCAELSAAARAIGSVNTVVRRPDGTLFGDNTDAAGFSAMLRKLQLNPAGRKALVLGSGGASLTVCHVLRELGAQVVVVSRSGEDNYENLSRHADARILVNTTPVGMYPGNGAAALSLDGFPHLEGVLDLIYNPARTWLILDALERGIPALGGLTMLVEQARAAAERFTGAKIDPEISEPIHAQLRADTENIVLIGMPGCGKTTVGRRVAQVAGRRFMDADNLLAERAGMSIPDYFATHSEAEFRELETQVLAELGKESSLVIATGGGCVTRPENLRLLRQNGEIFFLQRNLNRLATNDRPLSQSRSLKEMYATRLPLYRSFADVELQNDGAPDQTAAQILEAFHEIAGH